MSIHDRLTDLIHMMTSETAILIDFAWLNAIHNNVYQEYNSFQKNGEARSIACLRLQKNEETRASVPQWNRRLW